LAARRDADMRAAAAHGQAYAALAEVETQSRENLDAPLKSELHRYPFRFAA
jgi:hypothetical protein